MASMYLAQQLRSATLVGTVVFSIFTLYELSRVERNRTDAITDSIISPQRLASVRLLGILCASLLTTFLTAALYLPYAAWKLGAFFPFPTILRDFCCSSSPPFALAPCSAPPATRLCAGRMLAFLRCCSSSFFLAAIPSRTNSSGSGACPCFPPSPTISAMCWSFAPPPTPGWYGCYSSLGCGFSPSSVSGDMAKASLAPSYRGYGRGCSPPWPFSSSRLAGYSGRASPFSTTPLWTGWQYKR